MQVMSAKGDEHLPWIWIATAGLGFGTALFKVHVPVSYTHLDVYKRQSLYGRAAVQAP